MLNGRRDLRAKESSSSSSSLCRKKSIEIRSAVTVCLFSYRTEEQYYPLSACLVVAVATRFVLMTFEVCYCCWLRDWYFRMLSFLSLDSLHRDYTPLIISLQQLADAITLWRGSHGSKTDMKVRRSSLHEDLYYMYMAFDYQDCTFQSCSFWPLRLR